MDWVKIYPNKVGNGQVHRYRKKLLPLLKVKLRSNSVILSVCSSHKLSLALNLC